MLQITGKLWNIFLPTELSAKKSITKLNTIHCSFEGNF